MTSTIQISTNFSVNDDNGQAKIQSNVDYTADTSSYFAANQSIGTTYEAVNLYGLTVLNSLCLINQSSNTIEVSVHPASSSFTILTGSVPVVIRPSGSVAQNYYVKANVDGSDLKVIGTN